MTLTLTEVTKLVREALGGADGFKPNVMHHQVDDTLMYLEKDCSFYTEQIPGTNISLLRNLHGDEIVGVQIAGWSHLANGL